MKKNQNNSLLITAFVLGMTSIVGQILLLRELVTVFYGNEMAYAVILASWMFWVAVGSYGAVFLSSHIKDPAFVIGLLQASIYFILPAVILLARSVKHIMNVHTGEIIGIVGMCVSSFLVLAPLTLLFGGLFTVVCLLAGRQDPEAGTYGVGTVYLWESAGAAAGGVLFSFLLVHILPAMHIAFMMGIVNLAVGVLLDGRENRFLRPKAILIYAALFMFVSGAVGGIDRFSRRWQWEGMDLVTVTDSIYGNIALTRVGQEYNLYQNGLFAYATRDALTSEEAVHFPLLEHPRPRDILLIGNGVGGGVREILKYPDVKLDYVELDSKVIDVSKKYLPEEYITPLKDSRVHIIHTDARWLVKRASQKYDVVIVNLADPYTALINRYYTLEFFKEARAALKSQGILALSVSSSENYLNEEARTFLRSINTTLREVFPDVRSIPGDTNIFLACAENGILTYDDQVLTRRLNARAVKTKFIREYYLPYKLSPDRIRYIEDVLKEKGAVNKDTRPIAYLFNTVLWSTHFNTAFKALMAKVQHVKFVYLFLIPLIILVGGWIFRKFSPTAPVSLSIVTTGFSEIIFQIVVILAFQTLYGYAYYKIGLIMASFMGGLCLGTVAARRVIVRDPEGVLRFYRLAQFGIVLYPAILPLVYILFRDVAVAPQGLGVLATVFAMLPVTAGFIGGFQYPLAVHLLHAKEGGSPAKAAGFLYAIDVAGAGLGALLAGAFFIPLYGIFAVAFLCMAINAAVLILLYPAKGSPDL